MSRHSLWVYTSNLQRHTFLKTELKRKILKSFKLNRNISYIRRYLAAFYLTHLPNKSSLSFTVYRCLRSGRTWSVNRTTGLSRFILRTEAYKSNLPGLSRASW